MYRMVTEIICADINLMGKTRQTNIEILRIIAMFMIIAVHADYWLLGAPGKEDFEISFSGSLSRVIVECITVLGTNVFVLISGYFSIRPNLRRFIGLIFQIEFFLLGIFVIGIVLGVNKFTLHGLAYCFLFTSGNWFIKSYIALYILAPILNSFVEHASYNKFRMTLILFFLFEFVYGLSNAARFYEQGYSAFAFIGLYLLGRYFSLHRISFNANHGVWIFLFATISNIVIYLLGIYYGYHRITGLVISYINPLVIAGAFGLLVAFSKWQIGIYGIINKIAASSFAVYLFATQFVFEWIYKDLIFNIFELNRGG